jgi:SRSO17 transposase
VRLSDLNLKVAPGFWSWIDGALFLPQGWFEDSHQKWRQRLGVPPEVSFKTQGELAWELIERALAADLPFDRVGLPVRAQGGAARPGAPGRQAL